MRQKVYSTSIVINKSLEVPQPFTLGVLPCAKESRFKLQMCNMEYFICKLISTILKQIDYKQWVETF